MDWVLQLLLKSPGEQNSKHAQTPSTSGVESEMGKAEIVKLRMDLIGEACTTFFSEDPVHVERAKAQYLFDEFGTQYLDCISNVQHVGHCHPEVVKSVCDQMNKSNCNVRFLNSSLVKCAQEITKTLPSSLNTIYFCNSGSEANDVALRMARDYTNGTEVIVLDHAYHGHISSMMEISPYKFNKKGGHGKADHVHVVPTPDVYRGVHRLNDDEIHNEEKLNEMGKKYALEVKNVIDKFEAEGKKLAAFFMESLQSCGGQIMTPPSYLNDVVRYVHEAGGLVVCDEVQTGFGRVGKCFWAFQLHAPDVIPDIVTMGKPMGNGFPVSATVARKELASRLGRGLQYFNTYGGNPVACAACLAVLRVIKQENLQQHAFETGKYFMDKLWKLQQFHSCIGDVRGCGLFIGIDLVTDRQSREPATDLALNLILKLRQDHHILVSAEGPHENIIKIKPPMCFSMQNVDDVVAKLDLVLTELGN